MKKIRKEEKRKRNKVGKSLNKKKVQIKVSAFWTLELINYDQKNFGQGFRHPAMLSRDKQHIYLQVSSYTY